jgi:hypothetical protein
MNIYYLDHMQNDVVDIEGNMASSRKIKIKVENVDKKKQKEEDHAQASTCSSSQHVNIEEMINMIKALSNKIIRLDLGNKVVGPTPQNVGQRKIPQNLVGREIKKKIDLESSSFQKIV